MQSLPCAPTVSFLLLCAASRVAQAPLYLSLLLPPVCCQHSLERPGLLQRGVIPASALCAPDHYATGSETGEPGNPLTYIRVRHCTNNILELLLLPVALKQPPRPLPSGDIEAAGQILIKSVLLRLLLLEFGNDALFLVTCFSSFITTSCNRCSLKSHATAHSDIRDHLYRSHSEDSVFRTEQPH